MPPLKSAHQSFEENTIPEPNSGCLLWTASVNNRGYGQLQAGGYKGYAHRWSYAKHVGPIAAGMDVCHRCDTPACVNPDHLFLGTRSDNMRDCRAKGRHASQSSKTVYARGERSSRAKLTVAQVRKIIRNEGRLTQRELAAKYGVSKNSIQLIQHRKTWSHVDA